jgi:uncharacterized membrane protein
MDEYLRNYIVALPIFVAVDFTWIGFLMKRVYLDELGDLARVQAGRFKPNLAAGLAAWAVIPLGLVLFAIPRLSADDSFLEVLGWGALLGGIMYGMYDLTNLATLRGYTLKLTMVDTAWGTALSAFVSLAVWLVAR